MRVCEAPDCNQFVFGTCKISRKGYCKRHQSLREDFDKRSLTAKAISKINKNKTNALSNKVKSFAKGEDAFRDGGKSKSELLKLADKLFGNFVKDRDKFSVIDEETGDVVDVIKCPCCNKIYDMEAKAVDGTKIVVPLHFIDRDVYSLRYDEKNVFAGDCYCNLRQHLKSKGEEYKNYREFLVEKLGEKEVAEMEVAHRKINRIETVMLKNIIDHYS